MEKQKTGLSIASMLLGIVGLLLSCIIIGIVPAIVGLILGIVALTQKQNKGMAITGIVCSSIAIFITVFVLFMALSVPKNTSAVSDSETEPVSITGTEYEEPQVDSDSADSIWANEFTPISDFRYSLDKESRTITLIRYEGEDTKILLSHTYTIDGIDYALVSMGDDACFLSESYITSVYIPEGVTFIGGSCFNSCSSLRNLYLPSTIEEIPSNFWTYIHVEYDVFCDAVTELPAERDFNSYSETQSDTSDAEDMGENTARAINGLFSGLNDSSENTDDMLHIYFGGTNEEWNTLVEE